MKTLARFAILLALALGIAAPAAPAAARSLSLDPAFHRDTLSYTASVPWTVDEVVFNFAVAHPGATVTVNGADPATPVALAVGENAVVIVVTAEDARYRRTYTVTVTREGPPASNADLAALSAESGADGRFSALGIGAFSAGTTSYAATVPHATTHARLTASAASARSSLRSGAAGRLSAVTGGGAGAPVALDVGANALAVEVTAGDGTVKTYTVTVTREAARQDGVRLTASFAGMPHGHDGASAFRFVTQLSEWARGGKVTAASFAVTNGRIESVREIRPDFYYVHVRPDGWRDVTVTLRGGRACAEAGAVCAGGGRMLANSPSATVAGTAAPALTAAFESVPAEHDGTAAFAIGLRFSEALGAGAIAPVAASFAVQGGGVQAVEHVSAGLWRVRVAPKNWKDVTVTLAGGRACAEAGAVCASGGRVLESTLTASVGGPARIRIEGARAREGRDESLDFAVTLSRAVSHEVSVDYATADGTATAGADYTAVSGTLTFAPGETAKTVSVPVLDDAIDEGKETMRLRLSNPQGAYLRNIHRQATGVIVNDDALQQAWLARFGRTAGGHVTDAVSDRLLGGLAPGAHATLAGQSVNLSRADDGKALTDLLTGFARTFGASGGPAADEDPGSGSPGSLSGAGGAGGPFVRHGLGDGWNRSGNSTGARDVTGRELLLGSSFHVAGKGEGAGPVLAAWGRVAQGSFDGETASDSGSLRIDGEVVTGTLGADADFGRMLAGVAVSFSDGEGTFADSGAEAGAKGRIESTMTTVSPYARFEVSDRVSAWGLAGFGSGDMTIGFDDRAMAPVRTDLSMQLGAAGARGALLTQDASGGMDLALKADAMFVRTESEKAANSAATTADASRLRLVLEGGRSFDLGGGATLRPSLELGVRHDGGDAETGAGVELGGGVSYTDAATGLSIEAKGRMLVAHADSDYEEWGMSATARLAPGERGRGLSFSLSPAIGAASSASERLWGARDARGLAPAGTFEASRGLTAEAGYGMALFGDRFTGTPNVGFGMSDGGLREYRLGWRLTSAIEGDPGFEVRLDATRREAADTGSGAGTGPRAEHGIMLRSMIRW